MHKISLKSDTNTTYSGEGMWKVIEKELKKQNMRVSDLAKKAGVNYPMLAELKSGKKKDLKFSNVVKIADALDVSLDEFRKGGEIVTKKQQLKQQHLKPKKRLREERLKREYTETYMADLIGLKNRKGYSEKEDGLQAFKDYEMAIISEKFGVSEGELFF